MTLHETYWALLKRARHLADLDLPTLRRIASTNETDSQYAADQEWKHATRGELIETILSNEFEEWDARLIETDQNYDAPDTTPIDAPRS